MGHPEEFARLEADLARADRVDEILRYGTPIIYFRRTATRDTEIRASPSRPATGLPSGTSPPTSMRTCSRIRNGSTPRAGPIRT